MPEEATGEKEFETQNESKKEKKEISDIKGVEIGTGPNNKISKDKTEVFPYHIVGIKNNIRKRWMKQNPNRQLIPEIQSINSIACLLDVL